MSDLVKALHLAEPELAFGYRQRAVHPKDGLFLYGPLEDRKPAEMRVGVIGTELGISRFQRWLASVQRHIEPAKSALFHEAFPGFEATFKTTWPLEPVTQIVVPDEELRTRIRLSDRHDALFQTVETFLSRLARHAREEEVQPAFWVVVIPEEIYQWGRPRSTVPREERVPSDLPFPKRVAKKILETGSLFPEEVEAAQLYRYEKNFHNQLKARLLADKIVIQIVRETTLTPGDWNRSTRSLQDAASVAWNLCTTAFYKAQGKPWRLADVRPGVCYVGLVFKQDQSSIDKRNACCGAQMFLGSGDGVVFRGRVGPWYSEEWNEFHLKRPDAEQLIRDVVAAFEAQHGKRPSELFIHGKTRFNNEEWEGFRAGVAEGTDLVAVRIRKTPDLKVYRPGIRPVIRGTAVVVNDRRGFLWASGFVDRFGTYLGWEVPKPLLIDVHRGKADIARVMADVMALTKLNFNTCIYGDGVPVTLRFADAVGEILTAAPLGDSTPPLPFHHYI